MNRKFNTGKEKRPKGTICTKSGSAEGDFATPASNPSVSYAGAKSGGKKESTSKY